MDSIIEARIKDYLTHRFHYRPEQIGTILDRIDALARMAGFAVDERFAEAGLGAGPEARVASRVVDLAMLGGGTETPEDGIKKELDAWVRTGKRVRR